MGNEDYTAYLVDQAKSSSSAFHEFRLNMEPSIEQIHVFVEGDEDAFYYLPEIRRRAEEKQVFIYRCGNKRYVVDTKNNVEKSGYEEALCLYFVDRDYDDFFGCQVKSDDKILVTHSYSIENHMTDVSALETILCDLIGVKKGDKTYVGLRDKITLCQKTFHKKILPILAISLAMREVGRKPNYNNLKLNNVFSIDDDGAVKRKAGGSEEVFKAFGLDDPKSLNIISVMKWLRCLKCVPASQAIRGKYDLWIFKNSIVLFVKKTIKNNECPYRIKIRNSLSGDGFVESIAGRLPLPKYISDFLDKAIT